MQVRADARRRALDVAFEPGLELAAGRRLTVVDQGAPASPSSSATAVKPGASASMRGESRGDELLAEGHDLLGPRRDRVT